MENIHLIINKPVGYTSSSTTPSIFDLLDNTHNVSSVLVELPPTLYVIDELDTQSEGLLVITGTMTQKEKLTSEYEVTIDKYLSPQALVLLKKGLHTNEHSIEGITVLEEKHKGKRSVVKIEAEKTTDVEIRIMFETIGYHVVGLRRTRLGHYKLGVLSVGKWKPVQ